MCRLPDAATAAAAGRQDMSLPIVSPCDVETLLFRPFPSSTLPTTWAWHTTPVRGDFVRAVASFTRKQPAGLARAVDGPSTPSRRKEDQPPDVPHQRDRESQNGASSRYISPGEPGNCPRIVAVSAEERSPKPFTHLTLSSLRHPGKSGGWVTPRGECRCMRCVGRPAAFMQNAEPAEIRSTSGRAVRNAGRHWPRRDACGVAGRLVGWMASPTCRGNTRSGEPSRRPVRQHP